LARQTGLSQPIFGVTLGSVDDAGDQLAHSAIRAGVGTDTSVHGVGDGAPWIVNQVKRIFGPETTYLIDFYHLCDYECCRQCQVCPSESPVLDEAAKTKTQAQPS